MENDRSYYMRRAAQERSAATNAEDVKARAAHEVLAERYHQLAHAAGTKANRTAVSAE
jgi:hypothetical protein